MKIKTQAEFDANINSSEVLEIIAAGVFCATLTGSQAPKIKVLDDGANLRIEAWESSKPSIEAWGSSQPRIEAWGSSQPRIEARESSQPRIEARESSKPSIVAWESSQPRIEARESSQPSIEAWGSSQPRIEAWESSKPSIVAWESSQPSIVARESSQPSIVAWGSSQPRIEARGYAQLSVRGPVVAKCKSTVQVRIDGDEAKVTGGQKSFVRRHTPREWCDYYDVQVTRGVALVYKAVDDGFKSSHGFDYTPGTKPRVPDSEWDSGKVECGPGGLYFSPTPRHAMEFMPNAKRFLACHVKLTEIAVHPNGSYPQKIKAIGVCRPVFEVDINGNPITGVKS